MSTGEAQPFQSTVIDTLPLPVDPTSPADIEIYLPDEVIVPGNVYTFYVRTCDCSGATRVPQEVPWLELSYVDACNRITIHRAEMVNCVDDTATVNGSLYHFDVLIPTTPTEVTYTVKAFYFQVIGIAPAESILVNACNNMPLPVGLSGSVSVTVQESDGAPVVSSVSTLQFLQSDGFTVADLGGGVAEVRHPALTSHIADPNAHHTRYTNAEADARVTSGIDAHKLETDPHPVYLAEAEADALYNRIILLTNDAGDVFLSNPNQITFDENDGFLPSAPTVDEYRLDLGGLAPAPHTHPEDEIVFDPVAGHHHIGTDSRAIGDRS